MKKMLQFMKNCSIARNTVSINYEGLYMAKQLFAISIKGIYTAGVMEKDGFYSINIFGR